MTEAINRFRDLRAVHGDTPEIQKLFIDTFIQEAMSQYSEAEVCQWLRSVGLGPQKMEFREGSLYADAPSHMKPKELPDGSREIRGVRFGPGPVAKNRKTKVLDVAGIRSLGADVKEAS